MTQQQTKVQTVINALTEDGWDHTEFAHTGGGCYAIRIMLGNPAVGDFSEILITGEDVFTLGDLTSDDDLGLAQWFVGSYNGSGDTEGEALIEEETREFDVVVAEIVATVNKFGGA